MKGGVYRMLTYVSTLKNLLYLSTVSSSITSSFIICQFYFQANVILILGNTYSRVADSRNVNKPEGVFKKKFKRLFGP